MACVGVVRRVFDSGWAWIASPYLARFPGGRDLRPLDALFAEGSRMTAEDMFRDAFFVQIKHCKGAERLSEGDTVTFDKHWNDRNQSYDIDNCTVLGGAACSPIGVGEEKLARIDGGGGEREKTTTKLENHMASGSQHEHEVPHPDAALKADMKYAFAAAVHRTRSRSRWGRYQVTGDECTGEGEGAAAVAGGEGGEVPPRYTAAKGVARSRR